MLTNSKVSQSKRQGFESKLTRSRPDSLLGYLDLPIEAALAPLGAALDEVGAAVLVAPPGAGKTTRVPLNLLDRPWAAEGRILMLEPRRLAARAAAERMAETLGEEVGPKVGYRVRGEARTSAGVRIEVVTEGILTRMIQADPALSGVCAVIFDEFHERSLHADLGLALVWEARAALREDLRVIVMSATIDAGPIASLLGGAPIIKSEGRIFPVETRWLDKPYRDLRRGRDHFDEAVAELVRRAHREEAGDILVFLPGAREIRGAARALYRIDELTDIRPLYGAMRFADQRAALAPAPSGRRKIVLATSIAETSLTVEGVRVVVDCGRSRRARFDPAAGMSRLFTERVSQAEAEQRRGRAGRLGPGVCYRLWTKGEQGSMAAFAPPEIEIADLAPLALELAVWGAAPADLAFLTLPPVDAMSKAKALLIELGALDSGGRVTTHGRRLADAPVHPRLAHMLLSAPAKDGGAACALAALLEDRDPLRNAGADAMTRLRALEEPKTAGAAEGALRRIRADAERLAKRVGVKPAWRSKSPGALIARAYPDRIAMRRRGAEPRFLLSNGKGAELGADDPLAGQTLLAVASLEGAAREAKIRLAAPISRTELDALFSDRLKWVESCGWSRRDRRVLARRRLMFGALTLEDMRWDNAPTDLIAAAMMEGVRDLGLASLPWTAAARRWAARVEWARRRGASAPSVDEAHLAITADEWLAPYLGGARSADDLQKLDLANVLRSYVGWEGVREVDSVAPEAIVAPTGTACRIDYSDDTPSIAIRLQELFGLDSHPIAGGEPVVIQLLSPAGRPVQTTADLPRFWRTSYIDVRKDMRGRYPRHHWPEDPLAAAPTRRAKPRG